MHAPRPESRVKIVVTGGAGFVGANLVRRILARTKVSEVVNLDLLTYAGNLENLADVADDPRYRFVHGDICDAELVDHVLAHAFGVVNLAAESHVDRSIVSDAPFVRTNVGGTHTLLAAARSQGVERFVQVSTDEVYGELPWVDPESSDAASAPRFSEDHPLNPRSPYAASKAAADLIALSHHHTHGLPVVVTRSSNNYGPYQYPEKLVAKVLVRAVEGRSVPVYGDGLHVRDWMHVDDHCEGLLAALFRGRPGRVYNFGGGAERTNLALVGGVLDLLGRPRSLIRMVDDRRGHDRRYGLDTRRATDELGWQPGVSFDDGLQRTVDWYVDNRAWWEPLLAGGEP